MELNVLICLHVFDLNKLEEIRKKHGFEKSECWEKRLLQLNLLINSKLILCIFEIVTYKEA